MLDREKNNQFEYGLIGMPLGQSYSPTLHSFFADYDYQLKALDSDALDIFLQEKNFQAINVTIPYKEAVIPYLDQIEPLANEIQAINTIVQCKGKLIGYNTDILGMEAMLDRYGIELKNKNVLILGTGGTSKTATVLCQKSGAKKITKASRVQRSQVLSYEEAIQQKDTQVIINTTPVGMYGKNVDASPIDINHFPNLEGLADVIYNPLRTKLILAAKERGVKACNGLYMLVMQAFYAAELFTGQKLDHKLAEQAYQKLRSDKENIVLIGMPSSGKTTIGQHLSELIGRPLIDTDHLIKDREKAHPSDIIQEKGEAYFRKIEEEVIADVAYQSGALIATGGGSILSAKNQKALKANSRIYFLDRDLVDLTPSESRPLSSSVQALEKRYQERYPIYKSLADLTIKASGKSIEKIAEQIKKEHFHDKS